MSCEARLVTPNWLKGCLPHSPLRGHFEAAGQAYVLRVPSNFMLTLAAGTKLTRAQAVQRLVKDKRRWEVRSAGSGSKAGR
jgi:hypothetical protein